MDREPGQEINKNVYAARQKYITDFAQNRTYSDPAVEDPFFPWKSSAHAFKAGLTRNYITPLTTQHHDPVIDDPFPSERVAVPRRIEWIADGSLFKLYLIDGTVVESTYARKPADYDPEVTVTVETKQWLGDDEFREVIGRLRQNPAINRTGVLDSIEDRREWQTKQPPT